VLDPVTTAKSARVSLAQGLNALQAEGVPQAVVELAAPIAEAMGALLQIERSGGQLVPHAELALGHTRSALNLLQGHAQTHPAIFTATEAVANSLGLVHALGKLARGSGPQPAVAQTAFQPPAPQAAAPQPYFPPAAPADAQPVRQVFKPGASPAAAGSPLAATYAAPVAVDASRQPQGAFLGGHPEAPGPKQASQRPPSPPMPAGQVPVITADLGTQSPTNFYKGLSGNDIIDHGGLFVSTYMIPKIGTPVRLKISLPGGYEFEANGVVRWSREASEGGGGAPPGFGAQLTDITQEARQLVYRYARNREPLFHDDL
jgi:PilZ domain